MLQCSKSIGRYIFYPRIAIKLAVLYGAFTINTIRFLEDLGFCPKGDGGRFVEAGGRPVPDLDVALVHGNGGTLSSQCTALLGTEAAR